MTKFKKSYQGIPNRNYFRRIANTIIGKGKGTIRTAIVVTTMDFLYLFMQQKKIEPAIFTSVWIICLSQSVIFVTADLVKRET